MADRSDEVGKTAHEQLTAAGRIAVRKELARLPELLNADEPVVEMARGALRGRFGLVAVTDRRLIFVDHALIDSRTTAVDLSSVTDLHCGVTPMGYGEVRISVTDGTRRFKILPKGRVEELATAISSGSNRPGAGGRITLEEFDDESSEIPRGGTPTSEPSMSSIEIAVQSVEQQLSDLDDMMSAGLLTEDAYQNQRERLLTQD